MAYVKQTWEDLPSTQTPITASRLNHMEDGIAEAWEHGGGGGAGESLPIGSEIEFDGLVTDIPTGWEQIDGNVLSEYVLYNNDTGATSNVTLNDDISNYELIMVQTDLGAGFLMVGSDFNRIYLTYNVMSDAWYQNYLNLELSGTTLSILNQGNYYNGSNHSRTSKIYKVIGYK